MEFARQVNRILHEEHMAVLQLLERLEAALLRAGRDSPPDSADSGFTRLMGDVQAGIEGEISNHFAFEENDLFPLLSDAGEDDMVELLCEEHDVILPLARRLAALAQTFRSGGLTGDDWQNFHQLGGEFVERLRSHIDKEELALIPAAEAAINDDDDMRLAGQYAYSR
jgi:hemerythrin-like domain-containing protein